jgi:S-(hydroxymethyl)glutathione dehydrogenase/alcohol dehydrogenase/esterase
LTTLLHHQWVTGNAGAKRVEIFLHGAFGQGRNLMNLAKLVAERDPKGATLLVDVREHGQSINLPGRPTMQQAAQDIANLVESLGIGKHMAIGHSMGGKVAAVYAGMNPPGLFRASIIDTPISPSGPTGEAFDMLERLERLPVEFESRQAGVAALQTEGLSAPIAQWMAQNLVARDDVYAWRFDLKKMRALIEDFSQTDLWPMLERYIPSGPEIFFFRATRSKAMRSEDVARLRSPEFHRPSAVVACMDIEGGHWLHVEKPEALADELTLE